ncbi:MULTISPECIES: hypothetical protein [Rhodanobacter]|jgi:DUF4097 and DUF4098 domain-containing protein YvlB|uniref:Polymer-forming cytoskeletal protein n=1 Tax=Rhodanobacter glycinis TaxID=582702 RepID=A0A1I4C0R1_9GAMM|nr:MULTISPECIES: hypothetical protein [Rhodanobacter]EIL91598.1 hypothetical protein UU5_14103 [Rhodanobacter sp. 115]SFK74642.1 hypothetical protein SAMN05192579_10653 [Rhodanobacter glycinis]
MPHARLCTYVIALLVLPLATAACVNGVNGSVDVPAGTTVSDATTVNGAISLQAHAKADKAATVNGSIHLAEGAQAGAVHTVNGDITLAKDAKVLGDAETVNGELDLAAGSAVNGSLGNVNDRIEIDGAHVGHGITTANGDIHITGNAVVDGGIKVEKTDGNGNGNEFFGIHFGSNHVPRIVIDAGATVNGPLVFERPVKLYINDQAKVAGPISGAQAVKFTGATPPAS